MEKLLLRLAKMLYRNVGKFELTEEDTEVKELKELIDRMESGMKVCSESCDEKVELSTLNPGETFKVGEYDFIVLNHHDGNTEVISKNLMAKNKKFDENTRDYKESSLKKLIESDIQPIIEAAVGTENLVEHEVDLTSVDMQNEFGTCKCKVRPITFDEARKYNNLLAAENIGDWWWTCTPWSTAERGWEYSIAVVCPSGNFNFYGYNYDIGVRPFCILKSNIFVSKGEN